MAVKRLLLVLPALFMSSALAAQEQPTPAPADLAALLREAEANSPTLRAAAARLEAARRIPSQVETPPDPEASVSYVNDGLSRFTLGESEFSSLSLTWTQDLPYPGKLGRSGAVAAAGVEIAAKALERIRLEVLSAVKIAYGELYRLDQTETILEETRSVLESLAQSARLRYEVGQGSQESVLKAQTEILRLEVDTARVAEDRRITEARVNAGVGRPVDVTVGRASLLPEGTLPAGPGDLAEMAAGASPEVGGLMAAVGRSEASLQLARLELKPDLVWSASYQNRGGLDPMVTGMFGLRLPVHRARKQAQAVSQAEAELAAARADLSDLQLRTRASVRELVARVGRADRLIVLISQGVIPNATSALESARASYGTGRVGFLDTLNDLTVLYNARLDLVSQESDRIQALAALEPLLGRELVTSSGGPGGEGEKDATDH